MSLGNRWRGFEMLNRDVFKEQIMMLEMNYPSHPIWQSKIGGKTFAYKFLYEQLKNWPEWLLKRSVKALILKGSLNSAESPYGLLVAIAEANKRAWATKEIFATGLGIATENMINRALYEDLSKEELKAICDEDIAKHRAKKLSSNPAITVKDDLVSIVDVLKSSNYA